MLSITPRPSSKIDRVRREKDRLFLYSEMHTICLTPVAENILRVQVLPADATKDPFCGIPNGPGIEKQSPFSDWESGEEEGRIWLKTALFRAEINRDTAFLTLCRPDGDICLRECGSTLEGFDSQRIVNDDQLVVEKVLTPDGLKPRVVSANRVFDKRLYRACISFSWPEGTCLYGLGQAENGRIDLRGGERYLHQSNREIAVPLLLSNRGAGLLFSCGSPMIFRDDGEVSTMAMEGAPQLDYYVLFGGMDAMIAGYRRLTGAAVPLPRWAYGYIQSQERYESAQELIETAEEYRRRGLGLDALVLDWCSWEDGQWGQKTFDPARFPDPKAMMDRLHDLHTRLMISIWPNMDPSCANYQAFKRAGKLLPATELYDPFDPEARALYWQQAKEGLFDAGIDAWWCDSCEPFCPEWSHEQRPDPARQYAEYVQDAGQSMPLDVCNTYALEHARTIFEGQRACSQNRVVNLIRSAYTGQQKYGTVQWSGDTSASWDTLRRQIGAGLNFCASGLPYWTLDIGAFFVKTARQWFWDGDYPQGLDDLGYRELYVRWFQLGAFLPVFRAHGTDVRREVWAFGEEGSIWYEALAKMIRLRYRLLPYLDALARDVWQSGGTLMRMLAFDFPDDDRACRTADEFMLGKELLVCPVLQPMYYEKNSRVLSGVSKTREVYLPKGADWYDFWTGERFAGGQTIEAAAELDCIPVFVRAGSILPLGKAVQHTGERSDTIELRVYPGADASFVLYEDAGDGYECLDDAYAETPVNWDERTQHLSIGKRQGGWPGMPEEPRYSVMVVGKDKI